MQLAFCVAEKTVKKEKQKNANLFYFIIVTAIAVIQMVVTMFMCLAYSHQLDLLKKPPFYINPLINTIISTVLNIISIVAINISIKFEKNKKQIFLLSILMMFLNLLVSISLFLLNSLVLSVLLIVSNVMVSCYFLKQLKLKSLGQLMFVPYIVWLFFNTVTIYSLYLLN